MRFSQSDMIETWFHRYDRLSERERQVARIIEIVALSLGQNVTHLWGEIMLAIRERSVQMVKAIAVSNHPRMMKKRIEFAQLPGGYRDRDALDTMLGALPSNKGTTFIQRAFFTNPEGPKDEEPEPREEVAEDLDFIFPEAQLVQEKLVPVRQRLLDGD